MKEQKINEIGEVLAIANSFPSHYIFRGQADASWNIESTLERAIGSAWDSDNARKFEDYSLLLFKQRYHIYDSENMQPCSKLSWLSAMQHYGAPTRLVDFTESFYVALYFAIEGMSPNCLKDFSVFAIDYRDLRKKSLGILRSKSSKFKYNERDVETIPDSIFDDHIDPESYDIVWVTEPGQSNIRLDRQSGCFLLSGNRDSRLRDVLSGDIYSAVEQHKIIFDSSLYEPVYSLLRKANVNSKTLYGDLGGLAKSIKMEINVRSYLACSDANSEVPV